MPIKKTNQHASQIECSAVSLNTFFFWVCWLGWQASWITDACLLAECLTGYGTRDGTSLTISHELFLLTLHNSSVLLQLGASRWFKSKTRRNRSGEKKRPGELWKVAVRCFSRLRILVFFLIKKRAGPIVKKEIWILVSRVAEAIPGIT